MDRKKEFGSHGIARPEIPQEIREDKAIKSLGEQLIEWVDNLMPSRL